MIIEKKKISKDFCSKLGKMLRSLCGLMESNFHYFYCQSRYQKDKYRDVPSHFSPFSQAQKMAPVQSTLPPASLPFPNINNTSSSSSVPQILPFNHGTQVAFGLMLERSRVSSWKRFLLAERQQMLDWITETGPQKGLTDKKAKRRS